MKRHYFLSSKLTTFLIAASLVNLHQLAQAQEFSFQDLDPVSSILLKLSELIDDKIEKASDEGDFLLQRGALELRILLQTLEDILTRQQDRLWKELSSEVQNTFRELKLAIEELKGGLLEIEDFVYLDVNRILNRFPFFKELHPLRRIDGSSQYYKTKGQYSFRLLGTAFGPGSNVSISIAGNPVPVSAIRSERENELLFSVPVGLLNGHFLEKSVKRILLEVSVNEQKRRTLWSRILKGGSSTETVEKWSYQLNVWLLPKAPVFSYILKEHQSAKVPGKPAWSNWGPTVTVPKAGRDCERHESCANEKEVCVAIPANAEVVFIKNLPVVDRKDSGCGDWCAWTGKPWVSGGKVCQNFKNWRKSKNGKVGLRVKYQPLLNGVKTEEARLFEVAGSNDPIDTLQYGKLYQATFSANYSSFDLAINFFNGETVVVTPGLSNEPISGKLTFKTEKLGGGVHRLVLKLGGVP